MTNTNQEEIDKIPMILKALDSMCLWDIPKERCDDEILFYRIQAIEFFLKYYSNWLDINYKKAINL